MVRITPFGLRLIVSVNENENKGALLINMVLQKYHLPNHVSVDPAQPNPADRSTKLRSQQEVCLHPTCYKTISAEPWNHQRQGLAYILVRQATSLLQRTRLNVVISCQAWHAKNARHMLLGEFSLARSVFPPTDRPCRYRGL